MDHTSDLRSSMPLAVGCPVTVTRNIMPQKRLYNGTSGTVTSITADIVHVQFKRFRHSIALAAV